jgi:hypothetical protein
VDPTRREADGETSRPVVVVPGHSSPDTGPLPPPRRPRKPVYEHPSRALPRLKGFSLHPLLDVAFLVLALVLTLWLSVLLLIHGVTAWRHLAYLIVLWAVLAYFALPRLHQLLTWLYVPDYFIGRTRTGEGLLGDPVNLGLDGSAQDIHAAMQRAGWTRADGMTLRSAGRMIVTSIFRRHYPAAPVSELYLFGRRHDFAYQQEVEGHPQQRHHVRFWRTPEGWALPGGHHVQWIAAGTFDRAVGLSLFTGQFTHRIDPDIDVERDYIVDSTLWADPDVGVEVIKEFSIAYHHRNGGGDRVRTDGDLPILDVTGAADRARDAGIEVDEPDADTGPVPVDQPRPGRVHTPRWARDPGRHHLPPPSLVAAGVLLLVGVIASGFASVGAIRSVAEAGADWHGANWGDVTLGVLATVVRGLVIAGGVVLWLMTLARRRWARLIMLTAFSALAVITLVAVSTAPVHATFGALSAAGFSVGIVLAFSADSARVWVADDGSDEPAG